MYAIVEIAGQQFKVEKGQQIYSNRLEEKEGTKIFLDKVLLFEDSKKVSIGSPLIKGAQVTAKVLEHLKADKVVVFKKKRRKGYKVRNGHRHYLTKLEVLSIDEKATEKKASKSSAKKAAAKTTVKKVAAKTTAKKAAAKTTVKKAAAKTTVKKAADKSTTKNKNV
tara:strand:- start:7250 stop:7747 length:498 start_codon:yes stop_codon:yes gene_type:complete